MIETVRSQLERVYWGLESVIDPGVVSSQNVYADAVRAQVNANSRWLDLGCGHSVFPDWIGGQHELVARPELVVGMDYSLESLRQHDTIRRLAAGDTTQLPFRSGAFNLITANMVFEHLADPAGALREMHRILEPGGRLIFHTPNWRHFPVFAASLVPDGLKRKLVLLSEGRAEADVFPTFYRINTARNVERFATLAAFDIEEFRKVNTSSTGDLLLYGPFLPFVLLWRRLLRKKALENFRSNFIVLLQKPLAATA